MDKEKKPARSNKYDPAPKQESTKSIIVIILVLSYVFLIISPVLAFLLRKIIIIEDISKMYKELAIPLGVGVFSLIPAYFNISIERK